MNTGEHLSDLFRYNVWANGRVLASLKTNECERARRIFAHLLTTQQEYFERLYGKDSTGFDFWPDLSIDECSDLAGRTDECFARLLAEFNEADLDRRAQYKTSLGAECEDSFRDLLTHVVIHSSIHRGNIIIKLRDSGFEPPEIDHILYIRENKKA